MSIKRKPDAERAALLHGYVGQHVTVEVRTNTGAQQTKVGTVVAIAVPGGYAGPPSTQLILQEDHPDPGKRWKYPQALSSAAIHSVTPTQGASHGH